MFGFPLLVFQSYPAVVKVPGFFSGPVCQTLTWVGGRCEWRCLRPRASGENPWKSLFWAILGCPAGRDRNDSLVSWLISPT